MKALAVILVLMLSSLASAHAITTDQEVFTYFPSDANGNVGFVYVDRSTDPTTLITTTLLEYSFCFVIVTPDCQAGSGIIPNDAFTGVLTGDYRKAQTVTILFDTTEFSQQGYLQGTGGLISLSFVTHPGYTETFTTGDQKLENFKVIFNFTQLSIQGPASMQGTILGTNVDSKTDSTPGITPGEEASWGIVKLNTTTGKPSKVKLAQSRLTLEKSLPTQVQLRLQALRGELTTK